MNCNGKFRHYVETTKHKLWVIHYSLIFSLKLMKRALLHDASKYSEKESKHFEKVIYKLKGLTYGSEEYKTVLQSIKPALDHHYSVNSHHPENHEDGLAGMSLLDIVEMFADWQSAVRRHDNGNIVHSINNNKERFGIGDMLYRIFLNSIR